MIYNIKSNILNYQQVITKSQLKATQFSNRVIKSWLNFTSIDVLIPKQLSHLFNSKKKTYKSNKDSSPKQDEACK